MVVSHHTDNIVLLLVLFINIIKNFINIIYSL